MSNYYLCDTCAVMRMHLPHQWWCPSYPWVFRKLTISDSQTPHEVCPNWKPKEANDADN